MENHCRNRHYTFQIRKCKDDNCCLPPQLTDEQMQVFEEMKLSYRKSTKADKDALKLKKVELETLITNDNPDVGKINALVDEVSTLRGRLFKAEINHKLAMRAELDDKQKMKFDRMNMRKKGERERRGRG